MTRGQQLECVCECVCESVCPSVRPCPRLLSRYKIHWLTGSLLDASLNSYSPPTHEGPQMNDLVSNQSVLFTGSSANYSGRVAQTTGAITTLV